MASGFSRRFGAKNKLLVPFRGKPLARHALDLVCGMRCFNGIFFIAADESVAALAADLPVTLVRNAAPEKGQRESVRLGVEAVDTVLGEEKKSAWYLFLPCDQPLLDADTINRILDTAAKAGHEYPRIIEPRFQGRPGNPCLFSAAFRDELLALGQGEKPRVIKSRHPEAVLPVDIANPLALADIDRPEDLERINTLNNKIVLHAFIAEDITILKRWFDRDHIKKWFKDADDWIYEVENRHGKYNFIKHFIVKNKNTKIGFCQYYDCYRAREDWYNIEKPDDTYSIDYLIGEEQYLGKGFGREIIRLLVEKIKIENGKEIIVQPELENKISQKALLANGFLYDKKRGYFYKKLWKPGPSHST
jgi:CTP:molybdopterin cytidylyltransferase MocA/predicted acetyltransferase